MPRPFSIPINGEEITNTALTLQRDEDARITLTGNAPSVSLLRIAAAGQPGGAPIIDIQGTSVIDIADTDLNTLLTEGEIYPFNIWDITDINDPRVRVKGSVTTQNTVWDSYTPVGNTTFDSIDVSFDAADWTFDEAA